ncbi:MAG: class D sortase [Bryobacteraceae bacterium]
MKVAVPKQTIRNVARWLQRVLLIVAVGALGYCGFVLTDTWMFQYRANAELDRSLAQPLPPAGPGVVALGGLVGRVEIPRLGMSVIVAEGTGEKILRHAVGHIEGTKFPGGPGNVGIAGHRDTLFLPLRNIQQNDLITLVTLQGEYRYRVVSMKIVEPYDVTVLNSDEHEILTLVTCHPFYFAGPAPNRFIVRAERIT